MGVTVCQPTPCPAAPPLGDQINDDGLINPAPFRAAVDVRSDPNRIVPNNGLIRGVPLNRFSNMELWVDMKPDSHAGFVFKQAAP